MALTLLPTNARARGALYTVAGVVGLLLLTQVIRPGKAGGSRGTPWAIVFDGAVTGLVTSLYAVGIVLIYRTIRVVNFAQGFLGAIGAQVVVNCLVYTKVPFIVALPIGILIGVLMGALVGVFMLRFFNSSRLFLSVVTSVGAEAFFRFIVFEERLPFWPKFGLRTQAQQDNVAHPERLLPFRGFHFNVGQLALRFGFEHLLAIELCVVALLGVGVFLQYTRSGTAVRALAENPERASLLGIGVAGLTIVVWAVAGALDATADIAGRMAAPGVGSGFLALLIPLAAAVVARFKSIPTAIGVAIGLGILREAWQWSLGKDINLYYAALFAFIMVSLLFQRGGFTRAEMGADVGWAASAEPRPMPAQLKAVTGLRLARWGLMAAGGLFVLLFPFVVSVKRMQLGGGIAIYSIAVLSLVVLTGWAGQVSLCQWSFVAIGSVVGGALTKTVGIPFWFAIPIVVVITAGIAVLVGIPALRIRGLFLLVSSFAFATAVGQVLFDKRYFGWLLPASVNRPTLFFINFEDERSMYYLCVAALAVSIWVVVNLRRSRVGRVLIALRDSEPNVQSFGISALYSKLTAFAVSGGLAGFAGMVFAAQQRGVSARSFGGERNIFLFLAAVVGGVSSVGGAVLGAVYFQVIDNFFNAANQAVIAAFLNAGGPLLLVFIAPGGFISIVNAVRDSVLRIIAQRRRIVVPSLFADYDPELAERQLIPLAQAETTAGLAALPVDDRFVLESDLYQGTSEDGGGLQRGADDAAALQAAARALADVEVGP